MDMDRFTDLLDLRGADPALWPDARERHAALTLLETSAEARKRQRDAMAFEATLQDAALPDMQPSDALRQRLLDRIAAMPVARPAAPFWRIQILEALALLFPSGRAVPQFAALALALAIGVSAGFANFGLLDAQETDLVSVQIASATPFLSED